MSDVRGLAVQAVALRVLGDRVKARSDEVKRQLAALLDPGDRKSAALDSGVKVGTVTFANPDTKARITNERALADWVADRYPDEVIPTIRPAFLAMLLDTCTKAGAAVDTNTGELLPGVEIRTGNPYLSVRPDEAGIPALVDAIRAGQLLALDGGDDAR